MFAKIAKLFAKSALVFLGLAAVAGPALADGHHHHHGAVPELSPGILLSAIALSAGGVLLLTDRFRKS
jgi:hypothetical protein